MSFSDLTKDLGSASASASSAVSTGTGTPTSFYHDIEISDSSANSDVNDASPPDSNSAPESNLSSPEDPTASTSHQSLPISSASVEGIPIKKSLASVITSPTMSSSVPTSFGISPVGGLSSSPVSAASPIGVMGSHPASFASTISMNSNSSSPNISALGHAVSSSPTISASPVGSFISSTLSRAGDSHQRSASSSSTKTIEFASTALVPKIGKIGVCALDAKARSKPCRYILNKLIEHGEFETVIFGDKVILDECK